MTFLIDDRILSTCFPLGDWPLSRVFLKNTADYPWLILVPRLEGVHEVDELSQALRHVLIDEVSQLSSIVRAYFKPDKLNVGALGNIVAQLHVHVIARFIDDKLWPHGVWQAAQMPTAYSKAKQEQLVDDLRYQISQSFVFR